jgi:hypothetical protein
VIDPSYNLQLAIAAALLGDAGVNALMGAAIYDPLSAVGKPYPFVEIGEDQVLQGVSGLTDEVWSTVHVWADGPGARLLAKRTGDAIRNVLGPRPPGTPPLTLSGFAVTSGILHSGRYMTDNDPTDPGDSVAHANLQFRFQIVPHA